MVVKSELKNLGLNYSSVELGEAEIMEDLSPEQLDLLSVALDKTGFELMDDGNSKLVENIKAVIIELVHYNDEPIKIQFTKYLSEKLHHDYATLASIFSEVKGTTIEHFYMTHISDKVKELIAYDKLSLTEIAYRLNYRSVAHLSAQFKKMTGLAPSHFKHLKHKKRITLENV